MNTRAFSVQRNDFFEKKIKKITLFANYIILFLLQESDVQGVACGIWKDVLFVSERYAFRAEKTCFRRWKDVLSKMGYYYIYFASDYKTRTKYKKMRKKYLPFELFCFTLHWYDYIRQVVDCHDCVCVAVDSSFVILHRQYRRWTLHHACRCRVMQRRRCISPWWRHGEPRCYDDGHSWALFPCRHSG